MRLRRNENPDAIRHQAALALVQLYYEGDAHLLGRLAQGSLVGMGVNGMGGVDVNWGTPVAGLGPRRNHSIGILIIKCTGAIDIQKVERPN